MICLHFLFCFSQQLGEMSIFLIFGFKQLLAEDRLADKCLSPDPKATVLALNHCASLPHCLMMVQQD